MGYSISISGLKLLEHFEGIELCPYCKKGDVPTIGIGSTFYPNGKKVTMKDPCITKGEAYNICSNVIEKTFLPSIESLVKVPLKQNQVDSLISFVYNEGSGAFAGSHLLILINASAPCVEIHQEFSKWIFINHEVSQWQIKRRIKEAILFCS